MFLRKLSGFVQRLTHLATALPLALILILTSIAMLSSEALAAPRPLPKIGIIGGGQMGSTLGKLWVDAGYQVMFASRHPDELKSLASSLGHNTQVGTVQQATQFGDVVVMAVPYGALPGLGKTLGPALKNKIVLDVGNPYPGRDGQTAQTALSIGSGRASAKFLPGAQVVRAFNSIAASTLASDAHQSPLIAVPLAGDSHAAVEAISTLIHAAGFVPVVTGNLDSAKLFQPGSSLFLQALNEKELRASLANPS
ncbi:NADPH-dependent F420 reductase [Serratia sp. M24T3]|uniref:NADPH-dependent F420 reductase n=1 Tax=Serratia sp. M24T3 TaxID=932213 RepID=UPI00025BB1E8|nr:NAD(P)-binding domain-containing protein [Serratia sp. M24T3]EIC83597.1 NADP oxidoreductase coenzyme F420-dependent [Serratia sp. M24T3]